MCYFGRLTTFIPVAFLLIPIQPLDAVDVVSVGAKTEFVINEHYQI